MVGAAGEVATRSESMVLPFIKLGLLAVKQAAKPVANQIKSSALQSEMLKRAMIRMGRQIDYNVVQLNRVADGLAFLKRERVPTLTEKDALTKGSDFLAELVVYGVSAGVLGAEYWISSGKAKKAAESKAKRKAEKEAEAVRNEQKQWSEFERLSSQLADVQGRLQAMEELERSRRATTWFGQSR